MTQCRVLRVIARMNVGGPAVQVTGLMLELDRARFEQRLLMGACDDDEVDYLELHGLDVGQIAVSGLGRAVRPFDDLRALREIIRQLREFRPDIVHTHTTKAGLLGRVAVRMSRIRPRPALVHTFHGHLLRGYFGRLGTKGLVAMERKLAARTDRLVAVGSVVRDELLAVGIGTRDQYHVVAPGISLQTAPARAVARARLDLPENAPVVAFVGRLTQIKRPDRLIAVADRVIEGTPGAIFVVAGDGDLLNATREQARSLGDAIRFLGVRSDIEVVFAAADAALLTSDNEGMPVSLIEAAMAGLPSVTTAVGSAAEVVLDGRTGLVVSPDVEELSKAVVSLLQDPERREEMGRAARRHAEQCFSRSRLVEDTAQLYEELLQQRSVAT
jgi:glycosyltransferase involved in cell wall biosynthesis